MPVLFKNRRTRRRDELQDILDLGIDRKKGRFQPFLRFINKRYKAILIALFAAYSIIIQVHYFNILMVMSQQVTNVRAQIESALQMRQNIVPALSVVVYQFINHEKNVFLTAVKAREKSLSSSVDIKKLTKSLKGLTGTAMSPEVLSGFMAVAENYPQLVSSGSYQLLISKIADIETVIFEKRIEYNDAANKYNTRLSTFPVNMIGRAMGFRIQPYYEWDNAPEWVFIKESDSGELPINMQTERKR